MMSHSIVHLLCTVTAKTVVQRINVFRPNRKNITSKQQVQKSLPKAAKVEYIMGRVSANFQKLLDKATSNLHLEPDWPSIIQICDLIRQGDVKPDAALAAIKKKIIHQNPHTALYGLLVLESCVKNCGTLVHDEVGTKQYMEQLNEIARTYPSDDVKVKILELIQAWAYAFRNIPKYRAVQDTVNIMKAEGYKFPLLKESDAMFSADTAPEWADGDVCHRCRVAFSMVQRKHHCRACGQVFCGQCSNRQSTLPKFGIEKEVRVCEACYVQVNRPPVAQPKETDLPAEYLNSSLAQQQQVPHRKTAEELQEEEDLYLAIALSQSEAEQKEKEKKRATSAFKSGAAPASRTTYSPPPSPGPSPSRVQEEDEMEPELAKYLDRKYWEQRQSILEEHGSRVDVTSPSAPNISSPMPQQIMMSKQQNGEVDNQLEGFVHALRTQVEIFVNRMKSNSSRGRSIANDSSVQNLFTTITNMHSRLLKYIQEQDDKRVYYEGLQDKLVQIKDARAALNALREEHREKLRRQAEEAERQRQLQMQQKLEIMRKQKQEYLKYQQELALQKVKEQEREMQMRQEQLKQQYMMGGYQSVSGFMGPTQGSPIRHVPYQPPASNYNPMSPTSQGVYMYGPHSIGQYPMQTYNMPTMNSLPGHIMGPVIKQEQQPVDPMHQTRESMARVSISGPGMVPQMNPLPQMQQPGGHPMPPHSQQGPPGHIIMSQAPPAHMAQMHGQSAQMQGVPNSIHRPPNPHQAPPNQIPPQSGQPEQITMPQISQGRMGPQMHTPGQMPGGTPSHNMPAQLGLPPQMEPAAAPIPAQITSGGPGSSMAMLSQTPSVSLPVPAPINEPTHQKEESKPETAELISFD